ncbi:MAG TPA: ribulose-phosphate 3-epimerase [Armatimonadota bacterium]|nr:ribulose-phosphate 3-epimerase [Armatimonadota bacterium]
MSEQLYPIFPSLLAFDFANLATQVAEVEAAGAAGLHFDLMDGQFVPNLTFGPMVLQALRPHTSLPLWAHLMVYTPEALIETLAKAGASRLYLHPESTPHIHRALGQVRKAGMEVGVAINPGTPINVLEPLLDMVDGVLIMSVNPGFGGQAFLPSAIGRVKQVVELSKSLGVSPTIECDGGVDAKTIVPLAEAGMTGAVVGSALFKNGNVATTLQLIAGKAVG